MGGMGWARQCTENQRVCWVGTSVLGVLTVLGRCWVGTLMAEPPNIFRVHRVGNRALLDFGWAPQFPELQAAVPGWEGSQEHEVGTPVLGTQEQAEALGPLGTHARLMWVCGVGTPTAGAAWDTQPCVGGRIPADAGLGEGVFHGQRMPGQQGEI